MGRTARSLNRLATGLLAFVAFSFLNALPAAAQTALDVQRMVIEEATLGRVPPALALAVAKVESNFDPRAESPTGAKGVMQLMPKTARDVFGVTEDKLWNARLNIKLGVAFLSQLYDQYGKRWDLALSHYNGGTLEGGSGPFAIPHDYTRKYVADVLHWQGVYGGDVFDPRRLARANDPQFLPLMPASVEDRPWRLASAGAGHTARVHAAGAKADRPWRRGDRFDPLEFDDWAEAQQDRIAARREAYAEPSLHD
jgi:hypothetical protein